MKKIFAVTASICLLSILTASCGAPSSSAGKTADPSGIESEEKSTDLPETEEVSVVPETESTVSVASDYEITRDVYGLIRDQLASSTCNYSDFVTDDAGNIISASVTGGNTHTMHYEYDDAGRLVKSTKDNKLYGTEEQNWIYDDKGRMIELRLVKTKNDSSEEQSTTYVYDENGYLVEGQRETLGGSVFDVAYENDEAGRIISCTETDNGEFQYSYVYTYSDGIYNPTHCTETSGRNSYEVDLVYDDRGRMIGQNSIDTDGDKMHFEFTYDVIGELTESPETTDALIPGDQWEYFSDCPLLPVPSSCVSAISSGDTDQQFVLPTFKGAFISAYGQPSYLPYCLDSSFAFTALDRYTNILTDVLGFEAQNMGTLIRVTKDGESIADLNVEIVDGMYTLTVDPAH